jgi:cell division protein FtsI/penicillin-binding protein 2
MADESPLVNRIRARFGEKLKGASARIPRRGCIRILLALALLIIGSRITGSIIKSTGAASSVGSCAVMADTAEKNNAAESSAIARKLGNRLAIGDVAALLGSFHPKLTSRRDTIAGRGNSVIAYYSIDPDMQKFIRNLFTQYKPRYGAAVVMNAKSGQVLALASYRNDTVPDLGSDLFLRAVFPAASIYKTVTAAAAIEKAGFSSGTCIPVTGRNHTLYKFQLKKEIVSSDEVTFDEAYAKSMNPVFARIGMHVLGRNTLDDYSQRFCFNTAIPFELRADTSRASVPGDTTYQMAEFASGFNRLTSLSPLHGALIASAVAERGVMPCPHVVDSICSLRNGARLYSWVSAPWKTCMTKAASDELRIMMNRVVQKGTARKSFRCLNSCYWSGEIDYGGKTGSIEMDSLGKVDWFVGFARQREERGPSLAVAIVTTHGSMWTVHSSYIASEFFRNHFRPQRNTIAASPLRAEKSPYLTAAPGGTRGLKQQ